MITMLALALPKMGFQENCLVFGTPNIFMAFWSVVYTVLFTRVSDILK